VTSAICFWSQAAALETAWGDASPLTGTESAHAAATARTAKRPTFEASSAWGHSFRLSGVNVEITPEPTPEERAAILAALEQVRAAEARGPGAWWEAGLRESVGDEDDD